MKTVVIANPRAGAGSVRRRWASHRLSFQVGTIRELFGFRNTPVRLVIDDCFDQTLTINTVVVANARYFGGGMQVAPGARVDDGLLDVTIFGDIGPIAFASKYVGAMYKAALVSHSTQVVVEGAPK